MGNEYSSVILKEFDCEQGKYFDFVVAANQLISTLLNNESLMVHSVTYRCKSRQSIEEKISRPEKNYVALSDLTDVAATRVTTYFADDVDLIARLIEREFEIDEGESIDKRIYDEPDRFGYLSLHFIVRFSPERLKLSEYRRFVNMRFEIQIRSILQHAWAEIEHDLGYKSSAGAPVNVRRRFARVASLLELADSEFQLIRQSLKTYEREVPESILQDPYAVALDIASIRALFDAESNVRQLDQLVATASGNEIASQNEKLNESHAERMNYFGITTVGELEKIAKDEALTVERFASYWMKKTGEKLANGIGLFYLAYVLAWRTGNEREVRKYLRVRKIGKAAQRDSLASRILAFSNSE